MIWYYIKNGKQHGPVAEHSIRSWLDSGFLKPDDLLWRSGLNDWTATGELPEFGGRPHSPAPDRPLASPRVRSYAGFWLRAAAYIIDSLLLGMILAAYWMPRLNGDISDGDILSTMREMQSRPGLMLSAFLLTFIYFTIMESSAWQASLGKKLLRIKVTDENGLRIPWWRAALRRLLLETLIRFTFGLICVLAGFTPRKQGVHDILTRCLVVRD